MADGAALVVFIGEYDLACKEQWRSELQVLCREPNLVIDFQEVTYLDVTCAKELMAMHVCRDAKGFAPETVILGQPIVRRLFDLLNLQLLFRIVDSSDDAARERRKATVVRHAFPGNDGVFLGAWHPNRTVRPGDVKVQHFDPLEGPLPAAH
ncbi:MAG: anti-sigma factor antagonist [Candidatus Eremiobacteraeota bacterium]|nr:anti-sigma factor antagonist [Candidatus Eremiobacteraeota bacterium]